MRNLIFKIWPFAALILICLIFFYPVWLRGLIPLPADFVVGVYYPWLDYKWAGYNAGVPVKNPITTDVVSFIFPMQIFALEQLKAGVIPLWNNLILTGTPLMANFQSAPFSPTNFVYFILPKLTAWSLQVMLQPMLASVFLYLLLRFFRVGKLASIAGGIFFAFAGFITIWMQWNGHGLVAAFFPLIILLFLKWLERPSLILGLAISIALALQIFSGYPQIILYQFIALILLILIFDLRFFLNVKKFLQLSFLVLLGFSLTAIQILPVYELLALSQRKAELVINEWAFLPWQLIITFLAPDYFGSHATRNYWGPADYTLTTGYSGVVVMILSGIAVFFRFKEKAVKFAGGLILLSLLIAFPNPLTVALKESNFLGLQAASAHRILVLSNLGFAILAAFGFDILIKEKTKFKILARSFYLPVSLLVSYAVASLYVLHVSKDQGGQLYTNIQVGLRNLFLPMGILIVSLIIVLLIYKFHKLKFQLGILLAVVAVLELFRFGWKFTPFSPAEFVFPKTPVLEFLQKQPGSFRGSAEDVIPINFLMSYGIETIEGYDAIYPLRTAVYLASLNSEKAGNSPMGRYGSVTNYDSNLLDIANVKYILVLKRDKDGKPDRDGSVPEKFHKPKLNKVFEDKTVAVLENMQVLPRSFMVYDWQVDKNESSVLTKLIDNFPVGKKVILEQELEIQPISNPTFSTVNYQKSFNKKIIKVSTDNDGVLFIADSFFPGWQASVDDQEQPILVANYNFMALPIKSGTHLVNLVYEPNIFQQGKLISAISLSTLFTLLCWYYISKRVTKNART